MVKKQKESEIEKRIYLVEFSGATLLPAFGLISEMVDKLESFCEEKNIRMVFHALEDEDISKVNKLLNLDLEKR